MKFALVGNQNTGKTLLFNQLTGSSQRVGNFPGVTVEKKLGEIRNCKNTSVVDLPGIYSLSPYTSEEIVTCNFLIKEKPDCIINIVDVTNIERNLYLTVQLLELDMPTVVALNMMDELMIGNSCINVELLCELIGVPMIPISALKNQGIDDLISISTRVAKDNQKPLVVDFCAGAVHRCIHSICHMIEDHSEQVGISRRFAASKIIEGDEFILDNLNLNVNERDIIKRAIHEMEDEIGFDSEAAIADMRYNFIEKVCKDAVVKCSKSKGQMRTDKIDSVLTHKYLGIPVFLMVMFLIFEITFEVFGQRFNYVLNDMIESISWFCSMVLQTHQVNFIIRDLIVNGIFTGVGSVLSFLPVVTVLLFFLIILESTGYMTRVAYIMDKPLRYIGLSGKSFVPMLMGFGCSVPAIMATRTIASERDRKLTAILIPFMSCSAKLPVYAMLTSIFFPKTSGFVMMSIYLIGILVAIICAFILNGSVFKGNSSPFVMELPNYRIPSFKSIWKLLKVNIKDFIGRAFTVILTACIFMWILQNFDFKLNLVSDVSESILANFSKSISWVFGPLGFGNWMAVTAILSGFLAKEAVVSTFAVLNRTGDSISIALSSIFTTSSALSFLIFTLLYTPCVSAMITMRREFKFKITFCIILMQTCVAWILSFIAYSIFKFLV